MEARILSSALVSDELSILVSGLLSQSNITCTGFTGDRFNIDVNGIAKPFGVRDEQLRLSPITDITNFKKSQPFI